MGSIAKMRRMVHNPLLKLLYSLGLVPFTACCLLAALCQMPRYLGDRHRILKYRARQRDRHWLRRELMKKSWVRDDPDSL